MSGKQTAISISAVFLFIFFYDVVVHGIILADLYFQTSYLWRPMEQIQHMVPLKFFYYIAISAILTALYGRLSAGGEEGMCAFKTKCGRTNSGLNFGFAVGVLMGVLSLGAFIYLPITAVLAISWFVANVVQGLGIGLILAFINCKKESKK